jgi:hypothetical protein
MSLNFDFYSTAGKTAEKKFNYKHQKIKTRLGKDLFFPDKNWQISNYLCDNYQLKRECNFNIEELKKNIKRNFKKKQEKIIKAKFEEKEKENQNKIFKKIFQDFKYKYHNIHISKIENFKKKGLLNKFNEKQNKSYRPNYSYLYQKIITGPKWSNLSPRAKNLFPEQNYITNLSYNDSNFYKENIKGFVDMSKQTKRKGIFESIKKIKTNPIKQNINLNFNFKTSLSNKESNNCTKSLFLIISNNDENEIPKEYKSTPDFKRYLSRDQINNLSKRKERITNEELSPNYNSVEERTKMMVFYSKSRNHKLKDNRKLISMDNTKTFDANKTFEKIYGNKLKVVPNFEKMISRKYDKLPFFLYGVTNRNIFITSTAKSLKSNNYFNSEMYDLSTNFKKDKNRYKNKRINQMRKCLSFDNENIFRKNKALIELREKVKQFNKLILNNEIKNGYYF